MQAQHAEQSNPWVIDRKIGHGGQGEVYLAHHRNAPDMKVALKYFKIFSEETIERAQRSVRLLSACNRPELPRFYDCGRPTAGLYYYAMEYVEGEGLDRRLKRGPLSAGEARLLIFRLATVLADLHRVGLFHRDLKPSNVMLRPDGSPVLIDFDVLHDMLNPITGAFVLGTANYFPPEILAGEDTSPHQQDLYGLGLLWARCLGVPALQGSTEKVLARRLRQRCVDPQDRCPARDRRLIMALTDRDPARRPELSRMLWMLSVSTLPMNMYVFLAVFLVFWFLLLAGSLVFASTLSPLVSS